MEVQEVKGKSYKVLYNQRLAMVSFQGELGLSGPIEYAAIAQLLDSVVARELATLTLNLSGLEFLNSSGINVLSRLRSRFGKGVQPS